MRSIAVSRRTWCFAAALAATSLLPGCVVAPVGAYGGEVVAVAPPPPRYEVVPAAPALGWIWIGGYWGWRGGRHEWVPGYWHEPRPGYRWVPHRWERSDRGWRQDGGRWER